MATLDLTVDVKKSAAFLKKYQRKKLPTAAKRSLVRAVKGGRTDTKKLLKRQISMKVADIAARIKIVLPKGNTLKLFGKLSVPPARRGKEFSNLGSFRVKAPKRSVKGKRRLGGSGVRAKVYGESKFKLYRGAFVWERDGGKKTVLKRVRNAPKVAPTKRTGGNREIRRVKRGPRKGQVVKRQPVEAVFGASLTREFVRTNRRGRSKATIDVVRKLMRSRFIKEMNRQLTRIK